MELKEYQGAIEYLNISIKLNPKSSHAFNLRGTSARELGMVSQARSDFLNAINLEPSNPDFFYSLAGIELLEKKYKESIAHLKTAIHLRKDFKEAYLMLCRCLINEGDVNLARRITKFASGAVIISPGGNRKLERKNLDEAYRALFEN